MRCAVTGAAGFIGSHLCEELLGRGHEVRGIDALVPYYAPAVKEQNIAPALAHPNFRLHRLDLRTDRLADALAGVDVVFHLAGMPGLNQSWTDFDGYMTCNVQATQRLLEAVRSAGGPRLVYASTSSVYGRNACGDETLPTAPVSPYGVTKLAGEQLCRAYADAFNLPVVVLRYFSVYGPRQRPDMGYFKFVEALRCGEPITVFGDGQQVRGNTYVADCVEATIRAADAPAGETYNVGGGETASVWDVLRRLEAIAGRKAQVRQQPGRPGDQRHTTANTAKIAQHLGWTPRTSLDDGLARQWEWQASRAEV
ncbi:MAG: NAD-dependent epimerase/dehydratase family protein [Gemmataceae bacterium]